MSFLPSISHPELLVSNSGEVKYALSGKNIIPQFAHCHLIKGPIITFRHKKKSRQLSLMNLIFETHIKKEKLTRSEVVRVKDDNYQNMTSSNLELVAFKNKDKNYAPPKIETEKFSCWMNGETEIFL